MAAFLPKLMALTLGRILVAAVVVFGCLVLWREYRRFSAARRQLDLLSELKRREISASWSEPDTSSAGTSASSGSTRSAPIVPNS